MDLVDAIKVEVSGTGVIIPKVKECDCQIPTVALLDESDNQDVG